MTSLLYIVFACFALALVVIIYALRRKDHVRASVRFRSFEFSLNAENNTRDSNQLSEKAESVKVL
jgi:hypothetical protein